MNLIESILNFCYSIIPDKPENRDPLDPRRQIHRFGQVEMWIEIQIKFQNLGRI